MSLERYRAKRKEMRAYQWKMAKKSKSCYLFLAPYAILFITFFVVPVIVSLFLSFTYYNVLEPPKFIGIQNYINLILADDVFLTAVKNTLLLALITGPVGYIMSFLFAWFINELPRFIRAIAIVIFYAPALSSNMYMIWGYIFSGDEYGLLNGILLDLSIISQPIRWLYDPRYMMTVVVVVSLWMSLGTGFLALVAGLQGVDKSMYEAGLIDGIKNRWQELWFITLPSMKSMLMFSAVMSITTAFNVADVPMYLTGFPSTDYATHTVVLHLIDYGSIRYEMGYASAVATLLFFAMILCNKLIQKFLRRVGT